MKQKIKAFLSKLKFWKKTTKLKNIKFESATSKINYTQPYIISVTNDTDEIKDFELFGASTNLAKVNREGKIVEDGITIKDCIYDGNYSYLLYETISNKITIGITYLLYSGKNIDVFMESFSLHSRYANGNHYQRQIDIVIDPYQNQNGIVVNKDELIIDLFTKIIGKIPPRETFIFQFYPIKQD